MTPDPMSEKYYGTSPYTFCNNNPVNFVDPDGEIPLLANFVGALASAGVEYGSQVISNIIKTGDLNIQSFTNVDLFDIGIAAGEGFITSGTNIGKKIVTKAAVELFGEIARNTVDVNLKDGVVQTPVLNSAGDVFVDTAVGTITESINFDVKLSPFKGVSNTKAVETTRKRLLETKGESLDPKVADFIRKNNRRINADKLAANKALSEAIGSSPSSATSKVLDTLEDEDVN